MSGDSLWRKFKRAVRQRQVAARALPLRLPLGIWSLSSRMPVLPRAKASSSPVQCQSGCAATLSRPLKILVAGVYLADRPNTAAHLIEQFGKSSIHDVTQRWIALSVAKGAVTTLPHTVRTQYGNTARFALLNELIGDPSEFDYLVICDDDVELPENFLDRFLALAAKLDFALCQPARTADSYIDLHIVEQSPGLLGRRTRFVEIGPLACVRRDAYDLILPLGDIDGMGWGWDFIWAERIDTAGKRMGIIDAMPIAHRIRPPATHYSGAAADRQMRRLLGEKRHVRRDQAFTVLEAYPNF